MGIRGIDLYPPPPFFWTKGVGLSGEGGSNCGCASRFFGRMSICRKYTTTGTLILLAAGGRGGSRGLSTGCPQVLHRFSTACSQFSHRLSTGAVASPTALWAHRRVGRWQSGGQASAAHSRRAAGRRALARCSMWNIGAGAVRSRLPCPGTGAPQEGLSARTRPVSQHRGRYAQSLAVQSGPLPGHCDWTCVHFRPSSPSLWRGWRGPADQ